MRFPVSALFLILVAGLPTSMQAQTAGVGVVSFPNSGAPAAQPAFLLGVAQLHNFEYEPAAAAFRQAQTIDPGFAMAYWGEAMTKNHPVWMEQDRDAARAILSRLGPTPEARLAKAQTDREKGYLRTIEVLYGEGDKQRRDVLYAEAVSELHRTYPDDPDAAAFHALALLGTSHEGRDVRIYMRAAAILEDVFREYPRHPGAVHYLIHCYDDPQHAPLGLRAARAYSRIAPEAGHAQHMTSHIFVALGMWDDTVAANEVATSIVNQSREHRHLSALSCGHYNYWLLYGYLQQGRHTDAKRLLAGCRANAEAASGSGSSSIDPDNSAVGSFVVMRARYLLDTEAWTGDVRAWTVPLRGVAPRLTDAFISTFAALRQKDLPRAREAYARFRDVRDEFDKQMASLKSTEKSVRERPAVLQLELQGLIEAAEGRTDAAIVTLQQAVAAEEHLPFEFGPPFVEKPSAEALGEALLAAARPADARKAFEAALQRSPERTSSLRGLAQAAAQAGDAETARICNERLRAIWHRADTARP